MCKLKKFGMVFLFVISSGCQLNEKDCSDISKNEAMKFARLRIEDSQRNSTLFSGKVEVSHVDLKAGPLRDHTNVHVVVNGSEKWVLRIFDDCYSKWYAK